MKILYDHQMFSTQKFGGVSRYFAELIKHLPEGYTFELPLVVSENQYLKEAKKFFGKRTITLPSHQYPGKSYVKQMIFSMNEKRSVKSIRTANYDLFHPTFYNDYFLQETLKSPYVITVHDLIELKFKDQFFWQNSLENQMEKLIKKATRVIAISMNTKQDLIEFLNINPEKIDVIYHGYNKPQKIDSLNPYGDYILYVGKRERYKNFKTFSKAITPLLNKEKSLILVCVGRDFSREERIHLDKLKIASQTIALNVDEKKLNQLYYHAKLFVFPSLYEGFGMPLLEAMANNCPVSLSNSSCFPEIAGDAGDYFDPYDEDAILHSVKKVLYDTSYRNELIGKGRRRLSDFSWKKTAFETAITYRNSL